MEFIIFINIIMSLVNMKFLIKHLFILTFIIKIKSYLNNGQIQIHLMVNKCIC